MAKRILIMGAGAVGSYVGGYMARMGEDVIFVDPWPEHVSTINNNGLTLEGLTTEECFNTPARAICLTEVQSLAREAPIDIAFTIQLGQQCSLKTIYHQPGSVSLCRIASMRKR